MNKDYASTIDKIFKSLHSLYEVDEPADISVPYVDEYTTKEQRERDKQITELLTRYVKTYKDKSNANQKYKDWLFKLCCFILVGFSVSFIFIIVWMWCIKRTFVTDSIVQLISVCVTFLTLIIGILKIITRYLFPEDEEKYITSIVEIIQNNDLKNKKENIKVNSNRNSVKNKDEYENIYASNKAFEPIDKL